MEGGRDLKRHMHAPHFLPCDILHCLQGAGSKKAITSLLNLQNYDLNKSLFFIQFPNLRYFTIVTQTY
jgi:hypothetical protein